MSNKDKELKRLEHVYDELLDARNNAKISFSYDNCVDDISSALNSVDNAYDKVCNSSDSDSDFDI